MNKYEKVKKEVFDDMINNGLFLEPAETISSMAMMIEMLIDRMDMLEANSKNKDKP